MGGGETVAGARFGRDTEDTPWNELGIVIVVNGGHCTLGAMIGAMNGKLIHEL